MAEQNIGTARIDIEVDTTKWDAAIASGKTQLKGMSQAAQKEYDSLNGREKRRVGNLLKQADTLGKTRAEQILYNAALRGVPTHILDELKTKLEANERATLANNKAMHSGSKAFSGSSKTARELQFAMRGLPAQFTDIATSIQGGQRPLTVLLQQGGQLKDMFGGIKPALQATGSYLSKLVNPYTVTAAAAGLLAIAWKQGSDELTAYNKALILTGGYAGVTSSQLQGLAKELDNVSGVTESKAAAVLAQVVNTGKFTADQISLVTRAAVELQQTTGAAIDDTVSDFAKLAKDPVAAIQELNGQYHFLTLSVYEQIKALDDQGRSQDAQNLAFKTYSDEVDRRTKEVQRSLGFLERGWNAVANAAKESWDAMLDVGREESPADKIAALKAELRELQGGAGFSQLARVSPQQAGLLGGLDALTTRLKHPFLDADARAKRIAEIKQQLANFASESRKARQDSERQQANDAAIALRQTADSYASEEAKRAKRIAEIHNRANEAAAKAIAAGDQALAASIRASEKAAVAGINAEALKGKSGSGSTRDAERQAAAYDKSRQALAKYTKAQIDAEAKIMDAKQRSRDIIAAYATTLQDMLDTRRQETALQAASIGMGDLEASRRQRMLSIQRDYVRKRADLQRRQQSATSAVDKATYAEQLRLLDQYHQQRILIEKQGFAKEQAARASALNGINAALQNFVNAAEDTAGQTQQVFGDVLNGLTNEFSAFFAGEKANWKDFARDILKYVEKIMIAKAIAGIAGGISDGLSFGEGSAVLAKGGVYDSPSLSKYSGGIYDTPQVFTFAKGTGIFGEAGPEAIMPLKRGPDGSLGVRAQGGIQGGITVQNYVTVNADGDTQSSSRGDQSTTGRKIGKMFEAQTVKVVTRMTRPGGLLWREYGVGK